MSFFQTLLNSYVPYKIEKNQFDAVSTSYIHSAYNSCYPIVDNTSNVTTQFRKKVAAETMLFLLAYGISYIVPKKGFSEFEYRGLIFLISDTFSKAVVVDMKNCGVDRNFIEARLFNYCNLLNDENNDFNLYLSIILNEKPLTHLIKNNNDFIEISRDSKLSGDLGQILSLNSYLMQAVDLMRQAMDRTYGYKQ